MASPLIVLHGGTWKNNTYDGGMKDYIPVPRGGISYNDLLSKLEVRLKKDKNTHTFDIDAMVNSASGESMRMKVTDEFEWSCLMEMNELPVLYVYACSKMKNSTINPNNDNVHIGSIMVPSLNNQVVESCSSANNGTSSQWIIAGLSQQASIEHEEILTFSEPMITRQLAHGSVFPSKDRLISTIHEYHLKNHLEFRTPISDLRKVCIVCKDATSCAFSLHAKSYGNAWRIYKWVTHTCQKYLRGGDEPIVSARAIAEYIGPNLTEDGFVVRARDIQSQFLREFGVRLKYPTALAGKNRALKSIYGDQDKSFQVRRSQFSLVNHKNYVILQS